MCHCIDTLRTSQPTKYVTAKEITLIDKIDEETNVSGFRHAGAWSFPVQFIVIFVFCFSSCKMKFYWKPNHSTTNMSIALVQTGNKKFEFFQFEPW